VSALEPSVLDRARMLMMAALDGEGERADREELQRYLHESPELAAEWQRLRRVKEVTTSMTVRQPPDEVWDRYRVSRVHRIERSVAWILLTAGAAVLGGWGLWHWLGDVLGSDLPWMIKTAIVGVTVGGLLLLASVIRERWILSRRDPYSREVIR
jgi:anti-sigma factor RsiW